MFDPAVLRVFEFNLEYARRLVSDVPDDRMAHIPSAGMNHPAWVLGHLSSGCDRMCARFGLERMSDPAIDKLYAGGTTPLTDRSVYPSKQTLMKAMDDGHARLADAVRQLDDAQLKQDNPLERLRPMFPTLGEFLTFFMTSHEAMHLGQLSAWRRVLGMPSVL